MLLVEGRAFGIKMLQSSNKSVAKMWWSGKTIRASNIQALFMEKKWIK